MEISKREDVDPVEALLSLTHIAMGRVGYTQNVLTEQLKAHVERGGDPFRPPGFIKEWMEESRQERKLAATTAKDSVNAGVMSVVQRRLDLEGSLVADALSAALDALDLDTDQRMTALEAAQDKLLSAE